MCAPAIGRPRRVAPTHDLIILLNCIILPLQRRIFHAIYLKNRHGTPLNWGLLSFNFLLLTLFFSLSPRRLPSPAPQIVVPDNTESSRAAPPKKPPP